MPFIDTKTLDEDKTRFLDLRRKFLELMVKYGYPDNDGRVIILNNICHLIMSCIMNMSLLISLDKKIINESQVRKLLSVDTGDFHGSMMAENDLRRIVYGVMFQFQIETLFKILLSELEEKTPEIYEQIVNKILASLSLSDPDEKKTTLTIMAYMRNCLHSNGVHTKNDVELSLDGYQFKFQKGKPFNQAKWAQLHFVSNNIVSILEEILDSVKIQSIVTPIPFRYLPS